MGFDASTPLAVYDHEVTQARRIEIFHFRRADGAVGEAEFAVGYDAIRRVGIQHARTSLHPRDHHGASLSLSLSASVSLTPARQSLLFVWRRPPILPKLSLLRELWTVVQDWARLPFLVYFLVRDAPTLLCGMAVAFGAQWALLTVRHLRSVLFSSWITGTYETRRR
jgi:hypothetical protein